MNATHGRSAAREQAQRRAFRLVHDIQADVPGAIGELRSLTDLARRHSWDEVVRAGLFGAAIHSWLRRDEGVPVLIDELVDQSRQAGDQIMLALGLALRSDEGFSGTDPGRAAERDADLAAAVVLTERPGGGNVERITALTACAIALDNRGLFELGDVQYRLALGAGVDADDGDLDVLLAPVTFNLCEVQVAWAAALRRIGDGEGVAARRQAFRQALADAGRFEMAESWRHELAALDLLSAAIAGDDVALQARREIARHRRRDAGANRVIGMLLLACALADAGASRRGARVAAEAAIVTLDPELQPHLHDLALHLAAEVEARAGRTAGLRYAKRQLEKRWATRISALGSMQALIAAERQASELDRMSRSARLDDLTGIGNRRALATYLSDLERLGIGQVALILFDVDDFKLVNDSHGHLAGDAVLVGIARTLEHHTRPDDLAVRLGGDEFAVVLAGADLATATERAEELVRALSEYAFDEISPGLITSLSAGVASGRPGQIGELWAEADAQLYQSKARSERIEARPTIRLHLEDRSDRRGQEQLVVEPVVAAQHG